MSTTLALHNHRENEQGFLYGNQNLSDIRRLYLPSPLPSAMRTRKSHTCLNQLLRSVTEPKRHTHMYTHAAKEKPAKESETSTPTLPSFLFPSSFLSRSLHCLRLSFGETAVSSPAMMDGAWAQKTQVLGFGMNDRLQRRDTRWARSAIHEPRFRGGEEGKGQLWMCGLYENPCFRHTGLSV